MPTREEFLDTGLTALSQTPADQTECTICAEPFDTPVHPPCNATHIFCDKCIRDWLNTAGINNCPLCRAELFEIPALEVDLAYMERLREMQQDERDLEGVTLPLWHASIDEAHRISGLQSQRFAELETFGLGAFDHDVQLDATNFALRYLYAVQRPIPGNERRVVFIEGEQYSIQGPGIMSLPTLLPRFIAMAHLVPALARVFGHRFTPQQHADWRVVVAAMGQFLVRRGNRRVRETSTFAGRIVEKMRTDLRTDDYVAEMGFVRVGGERYVEFRELMCFVAFLAWEGVRVRAEWVEVDREWVRSRTGMGRERSGCVGM